MSGRSWLAVRVAFAAYTAVVLGWLTLGLLATLAETWQPLRELLTGLVHARSGPEAVVRLAAALLGHAEPADPPTAHVVLDYAFSASNLAVGLLLVTLRPRHVVARLLAFGLVGTSGAFSLSAHRSLDVVQAATGHDVDVWHLVLLHVVGGVCYAYALLLFPGGTGRARPASAGAALLRVVLLVAGNAVLLLATLSTGVAHTLAFVVVYGVGIPVLGIAVQRRRARTLPSARERQQSRLLVAVLLLALAATVTVGVAGLLGDPADVLGADSPEVLVFRLLRVLFAVIPLVVVVGVLRLQLWDVERLLSRVLRYGALVALGVASYVALAWLAVDLVGTEGVVGPGVVAALLAAGLQPVHGVVRCAADRVVYGPRVAPHALLTGLARDSRGVSAGVDVLGVVATAVRAALPGAHCEVRLPSGTAVRAPDGARDDWDATVPVVHLGRPVGEVAVALPAGERVDRAARRLLADLARTAAPALSAAHAVEGLKAQLAAQQSLEAELRASCAEIVRRGAAERRRLERDIHDGAQQQLFGVQLRTGSLGLPGEDVARSLRELAGALEEAEQEVRRIAQGVAPPLLASLGLAGALAGTAGAADGAVRVDVADLAGVRLPRDVELSAWYCCQEAVQNALRHAPGAALTVRASLRDGALDLEVRDDGPGFDAAASPGGTGLAGLRLRAAGAGGTAEVLSAPGAGTTVRVRLPLPLGAEVPTPCGAGPGAV